MRPVESFSAQPIRSLQTMLRVIAADQGRTVSVIPDGIYGNQTMQEIAAFQRQNGLPATGVTDQRTWERVVEAYRPALIRIDQAHPLYVVLEPGQVVHKNEYHPNVYIAQSMLKVISDVYSSIGIPSFTGIIDIPTSQSLSDFQLISDLPSTGELDKTTWKHLTLQYPLAANLQLSGKGRRNDS